MTPKTLLLALALAVAPSLGAALCSHDRQDQAMSCAEGSSWDAAQGKCVTSVNS